MVAPGRGVAATGGGSFTTGNAKSTEHGTPMGFKTFFPLPPVALRATGGYQQTTPYGVKNRHVPILSFAEARAK